MMGSIERARALCAGLAASVTLGCVGVPVHAEGHGPVHRHRSGVFEGAIVGSMAGAALGAGLDHRHRGRGAVIGGIGGLILGAVFRDQFERHADRWHRSAPPEDHGPWCDGRHTWEEEDDGYYEPPPDPPEAAVPEVEVDPEGPDDSLESFAASPEVLFDPGSATLTRGAQARLRLLARAVRDYEGPIEVLLRGHSDEIEQGGFDLSEARARAVRAFLAEEGVSVRRISWVGFGSAQPVASNDTAVGRQRNRRVEIVLREPDPGLEPYVGAG
ncbi:MAG: OmpA family protein [Myxococcota bacterium]